MNKKQLVAQLSGSLNLSKADAERTFDTKHQENREINRRRRSLAQQ